MPKTKKDEYLYKGYFNYRILKDSENKLKTYYFEDFTKKQVESMRKQFSNPQNYHFFGDKVTEYSKPTRA